MKNKSNPPVIRHICQLWTLVQYPSKQREWSLDEKVARVKAAGFDGFAWAPLPEVAAAAQKHRMLLVNYMDIGGANEIEEKLKRCRDCNPIAINIQLADHDTPTEVAVPLAIKVVETAEKLGVRVGIEVHRDICTETPEKTYALAAGFEKVTGRPIPLTWDFSHLAIVKHLAAPYWDRLAQRLDLIRFADQFHFRPFNGHHCQIPSTFDGKRFTPEYLLWLEFADKLIGAWLEKAKPGREMIAVPEHGPMPGGYALSVFPDVWKDAQVTRREVDKIWKKHLKKWKAK